MSGPELKESNRTIAVHLLWSGIRVWGERSATLIVFVILARMLGPQKIGLLAYINAIVFIFQTAADGALGEWLVQARKSSAEQEYTIFFAQTLFGVATAAVLSLAGFIFGEWLTGFTDAGTLTAMLSIGIPLACMARVPEAMLRRELRFQQLAYRSLTTVIVGGVVGIGLAVLGFGVWSLAWKQIAEAVLRLWVTFRLSGWRPKLYFKLGEISDAISYAFGVLSNWMFDAISFRVDTLIVGAVLGPTALGYYAVAARGYQIIMDVFTGTVWQVAFPHLSKVSNEPTELKSLYVRFISGSTWYLAPVIAIVAASSPALIPTTFGAQWTPSWPVFQWLCVIPFIASAGTFNSCVLLACGSSHKTSFLSGCAGITSIVGASIGSVFGIIGAAIGMAMRSAVVIPLGFFLAYKYTKVTFFEIIRVVAPGLFLSAGAFLATRLPIEVLSGFPELGRLVVGVSCGLITVAGTIATMAPTSTIEGFAGVARSLKNFIQNR